MMFLIFLCVQIAELEAQCNEANQEKQRNAQLSVRVQELEAELHDKEQVRRLFESERAIVKNRFVCKVGITTFLFFLYWR